MKRRFLATGVAGLLILGAAIPPNAAVARNGIDQALQEENASQGVKRASAPVVNDLAYLRRVTIDLIGRIPTAAEIREYSAWPSDRRREKLVEKLLKHPRFAGRWTVFFGDMLRLRSNVEGGAALTAFVYQSIENGMPYDVLARRLIATNGKAGQTPEVGFILGDNADPMALAGATSQVFMGVRIACAQCHDHPFDKWKRKDFYGFAAYFGKTRRVQRRFKNRLLATYTTETEQTSVMWPPEGVGEASARKAMKPIFPIVLDEKDGPRKHLARFLALRAGKTAVAKIDKVKKSKGASIDDLLDEGAKKAENRTKGIDRNLQKVASDARKDVKTIASKGGGYRHSELRQELADQITNSRNRYFSRAFVNRIWKELVGRGFVEPIDDFTGQNKPSHPQTMDYIADEFVAHGYDLRQLIRMIVTSDTYQRQHAGGDEKQRVAMEAAFLATPMRRMISEALYDSLVTAGHLGSVKHTAGKNLKVAWQLSRIMKQPKTGAVARITPMPLGTKVAMIQRNPGKPAGRYSVEKAIEIDFKAILNGAGKKTSGSGVMVDQMKVKSKEELEAERMQAETRRQNAEYIDRFVRTVFDDNPQFGSSLRMASPAAPEHFLRVFGQPGRSELGDFRDDKASMRQALILLNGRLTHEAARVGEKEPIYPLLVGKGADVNKAIALAYREILTREPSAEEITDAKQIIATAGETLKGIADLRWVLLNCNEFRFLP